MKRIVISILLVALISDTKINYSMDGEGEIPKIGRGGGYDGDGSGEAGAPGGGVLPVAASEDMISPKIRDDYNAQTQKTSKQPKLHTPTTITTGATRIPYYYDEQLISRKLVGSFFERMSDYIKSKIDSITSPAVKESYDNRRKKRINILLKRILESNRQETETKYNNTTLLSNIIKNLEKSGDTKTMETVKKVQEEETKKQNQINEENERQKKEQDEKYKRQKKVETAAQETIKEINQNRDEKDIPALTKEEENAIKRFFYLKHPDITFTTIDSANFDLAKQAILLVFEQVNPTLNISTLDSKFKELYDEKERKEKIKQDEEKRRIEEEKKKKAEKERKEKAEKLKTLDIESNEQMEALGTLTDDKKIKFFSDLKSKNISLYKHLIENLSKKLTIKSDLTDEQSQQSSENNPYLLSEKTIFDILQQLPFDDMQTILEKNAPIKTLYFNHLIKTLNEQKEPKFTILKNKIKFIKLTLPKLKITSPNAEKITQSQIKEIESDNSQGISDYEFKFLSEIIKPEDQMQTEKSIDQPKDGIMGSASFKNTKRLFYILDNLHRIDEAKDTAAKTLKDRYLKLIKMD